MMDLDLRNAHIGLAVGIVVLVLGCYFFRDSGDDALELVGLFMLVVSIGTTGFLNWRDDRRHGRDQ